MGPPFPPSALLGLLLAAEPKFEQVLFSKEQRLPLSRRVREAIEQNWPIYFPTDPQCRGKQWSRTIFPTEAPYKPRASNVEMLETWRSGVRGTLGELLDSKSAHSWNSLFQRKLIQGLLFLKLLTPLFELMITTEKAISPLLNESALGWSSRQESLFWDKALPYRFASTSNLTSLKREKDLSKKILLIRQMQFRDDFPFMYLGCLQDCIDRWNGSAIPEKFNVRRFLQDGANEQKGGVVWKAWTDWAMRCACPEDSKNQRNWARRMLEFEHSDQADMNDVVDDRLGNKCIQISRWRSGTDKPSLTSVKAAWWAVPLKDKGLCVQGMSEWLFYWGVVLLIDEFLKRLRSDNPNNPAKLNECLESFARWKTYFSRKAANG